MTDDEKQALHIKIARDPRYRRLVDVKDFDASQTSIVRADERDGICVVYALHSTGRARDGIDITMVPLSGVAAAIRQCGSAAHCSQAAIDQAVAAAATIAA
jgi:hypothetical protein